MARNKKRRGRHARARCNASAKRLSNARPGQPLSPTAGRKLRMEPLEDRRLLATFAVNNFGDLNGGVAVVGSLRQAIELSNAADNLDTIVFEDFLFFGAAQESIVVAGELTISNPLRIYGPGASKLAITGSGGRVFNIDNGDDDGAAGVTLGGMTITGGSSDMGGGIFNKENLTLVESVVTGNSAQLAGGGIFVERGKLSVDRSVISDNSAGLGGGVHSGLDGDDTRPTTLITNSTITGNTASGTPDSPAYGGGIFNRNGRTLITHSTVAYNSAYTGYGVASFGNPLPEEEGADPPPPTVFTYLGHSIFWQDGAAIDVATVGMSEDDPPVPFLPSIESRGFNLIGGVGTGVTTDPSDIFGAAANPLFVADPITMSVELMDVGGSTETFVPNADPLLGPISPAIDAGDPAKEPSPFDFDTRGRHFIRVADGNDDATPGVDIGAYEAQVGNWLVDALIDESDGQFSTVWDEDPDFLGFPVVGGYDAALTLSSRGGDFTLREALEFAEKNPIVPDGTGAAMPGVPLIQFTTDLLLLPDPNPFSSAPTIDIDTGLELPVTVPVIVQGPTTFELEVDASNSDPTPALNDSNGIRVLIIDDDDATTFIDVSISNLTIMGGDIGFDGAVGGGILNRENLTLTASTIKENGAGFRGGGIYNESGTLDIDSSTLSNNGVAQDGGSLFVEEASGAITISNSTISGNTSGVRGAGIFNEGATRIEYSTITNNNAFAFVGSGILNSGATAVLDVTHTIISGNVNFDIDQLGGATVNSSGYNLVGDGSAAAIFTAPGDLSGAAFKNPQLKPLSKGGGPTLTHEPLPASPVIDAGDIAFGGVPANDQRGELYFRVDGAAIDIGSYELQGLTYFVDNPLDVDDGNFGIEELSLREAINLSNTTPLRDVVDLSFLAGMTIQIDNTGQASVPTDLVITDTVGINGSGVTIDGPADNRVFLVDDNDDLSEIDVVITDFTVLNTQNSGNRGSGVPLSAEDGLGGVIYNSEDLTLRRLLFINNSTLDPELMPLDPDFVPGAEFHGGTIAHRLGDLVIEDSSFLTSKTEGVNANGGAIYARDGNVTISDSFFSGGGTVKSDSDGGALSIRNGELTVSNTIISANLLQGGSSQGAGIYSYADAGEQTIVTLTDSIVSGNSSMGTFSAGTGISNWNSDVTLHSTIVSGNNSLGTLSGGAGIYQTGGTLTIHDSLIAQNTTAGANSDGGGIANSGGTVLVNQSRILNNSTAAHDVHGGGVHNLNGNLEIRDSTIADNRVPGANSNGGGIASMTDLMGLTTSIINSTVSGNSATKAGGGVYNAGGLTTIQHSTVTKNEVSDYGFGAGAASYGNAATTLTEVHSSIISGNETGVPLDADFVDDGQVNGLDFLTWQRGFGSTNASKAEGDATGDQLVDGADLAVWQAEFGLSPQASDVDRVGGAFQETFTSLDFNLIGAGLSSSAFDPMLPLNPANDQVGITDPKLGPLANNGGPTRTHALLAGSLAIDAGSLSFDPNLFTPPLLTDQRGAGFDRVSGGQIDIGSFEVPVIVVAVAMSSEDPGSEQLPLAAQAIASPLDAGLSDAERAGIASHLLRQGQVITHRWDGVLDKTGDGGPETFIRDALLTELFPAQRHEDFSDIATSRSVADSVADDATYAAEDHLFDLLGSEIL